MKFFLASLLFLAVTFTGSVAKAQDQAPKLELYGGYSYIRFNINYLSNGHPSYDTYNGNGGSGDLVYNPTNWLGLVGNAGGFWATNGVGGGAAIPYLFGPRFNLRRKFFNPFAQVLLGGVATSSGIETLGWQSHFAMAAGGGIDLKLSKHFSIRPLQAQYLMTKIPDGLSNRQNNFQLTTGISLLFGGK